MKNSAISKKTLLKIDQFPEDLKPFIIPKKHHANLVYKCLNRECRSEIGIDNLIYVCPYCGHVLLLEDKNFCELQKIEGHVWQKIFDYRRMLNSPALKGIYLFHEFVGPVIPLEYIVYLGEGHTPVVEANKFLQEQAGFKFYLKNDGQNPSASFKDRGMASAISYINFLVRSGKIEDVLSICASTGDTSASAALFASYLQPLVKSAVLLPHRKVTPQQLSQPLGNGAQVFEIPGVFDDCMKIVEALSEKYNVALLNSKNAWRILGQESYSYEIAQQFDWDTKNLVIVAPIGNAGNITALIRGFLKFFEVGIIRYLPKIIGVQSEHANPVCSYYKKPKDERVWKPVAVKPSVAQAALIVNPVSMPRVRKLVRQYNNRSYGKKVYFIDVPEQAIMDWQLLANRNGNIACTHGGEALAGAVAAKKQDIIKEGEIVIIDSTAHALKFSEFQNMYFENSFPPEFEITPNTTLINQPQYVHPIDLKKVPTQNQPLKGEDHKIFVERTAKEVAQELALKAR